MARYWALWLDWLISEQQTPPSTLRTVLLGSDRVRMADYQRWQAFEIPIVNACGLIETGCASIAARFIRPQPPAEYLPNGRPLANSQVVILYDATTGADRFRRGGLYIVGLSVGLEYLGEPARTDVAFIKLPLPAGRCYKTGDRVRWRADGNVDHLGRLDDQMKIRGFRIKLGNIDCVLEAEVIAQLNVQHEPQLVA